MKAIIFFTAIIFGSTGYASGQWVPYNYPQLTVQEQVVSTKILTQTVCPQPQYYIEYQLVPQVVMRPTVKTTKRIFFREETIEQMVPVTEWVYQPVLVYR